MNMTLFKRELMNILIDDDACLPKLMKLHQEKNHIIHSNKSYIKDLEEQLIEIEELIIFLKEPKK